MQKCESYFYTEVTLPIHWKVQKLWKFFLVVNLFQNTLSEILSQLKKNKNLHSALDSSFCESWGSFSLERRRLWGDLLVPERVVKKAGEGM